MEPGPIRSAFTLGSGLIRRHVAANGDRASHPVAEQAEAERLFLVRDGDADPARNRLGILSNDLLRANSQELLEQLSAPSLIAEPTAMSIGGAEQTHAMGVVR